MFRQKCRECKAASAAPRGRKEGGQNAILKEIAAVCQFLNRSVYKKISLGQTPRRDGDDSTSLSAGFCLSRQFAGNRRARTGPAYYTSLDFV